MDQEENKELVWKACNGSAIRIFYEAARNYVQFLKDNVIDESSAPELIEMLIDLYSQGSKLPRDEDVHRIKRPILEPPMQWAGNHTIRFRYSPIYYGCLNPFHDEICNRQLSLSADLGNIAEDLMAGIKEYEKEKSNKALKMWRDGWRLHWGQHAVAAIRVLHWMITEHGF